MCEKFLQLEAEFAKLERLDPTKITLVPRNGKDIILTKSEIPDNVVDFIIKFFLEYNSTYNTYLDGGLLTFGGRRRSIQELYDIILSFFPGYTLKEYFTDILHVSWKLPENTGLMITYCCDIKRVVLWTYNLGFYTNGNFYMPIKFPKKCFYKGYIEKIIIGLFCSKEVLEFLIGDKYIAKK